MEYILTSTGKRFSVTLCGGIADLLYITFDGYTLREIIDVFLDPNETSKISHYFYDEALEKEYSWYTTIVSISFADGNVKLILRNETMI